MTNAVVIFMEGKLDCDKIELPRQGKVIVIGGKNKEMPMPLVVKLMASKNVELEYVECEEEIKAAFLLGRYTAAYNITAIYSANEKFKSLVSGKAPSKRKPKTAPAVKDSKEDLKTGTGNDKPLEKVMNPPVEAKASKPSVAVKELKTTTKPRAKKQAKKKALSEVTEAEIVKILKKHKIDEKLSKAIHDAVITSTDVTLGMMVRTKIAALVSGDKCKEIGEIIKKELL